MKDLCARDIFTTSYMRHYVLRYTIKEALTFNAWQLFEQMAGCPNFSISEILVVEGVFKMFQIAKRFWQLIFKVDEA